MSNMLSARQFRARWAKLPPETIAVTVSGREIGYWVPIGSAEWAVITDALKEASSSSPSNSEPRSSPGENGEPRPT